MQLFNNIYLTLPETQISLNDVLEYQYFCVWLNFHFSSYLYDYLFVYIVVG